MVSACLVLYSIIMNYSPVLFLKDFVWNWNRHADSREGGLRGQVSGWQLEDAEFHHYELQSSLDLERFCLEQPRWPKRRRPPRPSFWLTSGGCGISTQWITVLSFSWKVFVWNSHADSREGGLRGEVSGWQAEDAEFHHLWIRVLSWSWKIFVWTATLTQEKAASEAKFLADKRRMRNFTIMNYSPLFLLKDFSLKQPLWPKRRRPPRRSFWLTSGGCRISPLWITVLAWSWKILFGTATLTQEKAALEAKFLADKRRMQNFTIMNYSPRLFLKDFCLEQPRWPKRRRPPRPSFWLTSGGCGRSGRSSLLRSTASSLQRRPPGEDHQ